MSTSTHNKAISYLTEGKVWVEFTDGAVAIVRAQGSDRQPYTITFSQNMGWSCSCPAHLECAHIIAAKMITRMVVNERPALGSLDPDLTKFFDQFAGD